MNDYSRRRYYRQMKFQRYFSNLRYRFKIYKIEDLYKIKIKVDYLFYRNLKFFPLNFIYFITAIIRVLRSCFLLNNRINKYYTLLKKKFKLLN
jgi:hypothetical protein